MSLYDELKNIEDSTNVVCNLELFSCPICFEKVEPGHGTILRECLHVFCNECIKNHIVHSRDADIKCPYMDPDYSCVSVMQEREIKALVSPEVYEKFLARSLQIAEQTIKNTFHCCTQNCIGWCVLEDVPKQFSCPVCGKSNCISCEAIHEGKTCDEYLTSNTAYSITDANQLSKTAVLKMLDNGSAMICPTCQAVIEKISGCDGIQCTICKTHLCWATRGLRWGKEGRGDMSGGCQCNVDGKKCHPECKNCH